MRKQTIDHRLQTADKMRYAFVFHSAFSTLHSALSAVVLVMLLTLSSCFKEKPLAPPNTTGIGQTTVIEMGPEYSNQYFYSLKTNSVITQNSRFAYDLLFECNTNRFNVWLNTAKFMSAVKTNKTDLKTVTISDTAGLDFHFELGAFDTDSSALGIWWDTLVTAPSTDERVYIISLGRLADGTMAGFVKMKFNNFVGDSYSVSFCGISDTAYQTVYVQKDDMRNYRYLSFGTGATVDNIEPDKTTWDLCFTRFTILFYDPYLPYEVTGVLNNPYKVQAYMDSTLDFSSITITDFNTNRLLTRRDAIGYQWKSIATIQNLGTYSLNPHYTYYIKADESEYYKLHFFQFDNASGSHGYPGFEFVRL